MSFVSRLPDAIICHIFQEWLNLVELAKFDTSFCCEIHRIWLLSAIVPTLRQSETDLWVSEEDGIYSLSFYDWIVLRKLKLNALFLSTFFLNKPLLVGDTSNIQQVVLNNSLKSAPQHVTDNIVALISSCPMIKSLKIIDPFLAIFLSDILTLPTLQSLRSLSIEIHKKAQLPVTLQVIEGYFAKLTTIDLQFGSSSHHCRK